MTPDQVLLIANLTTIVGAFSGIVLVMAVVLLIALWADDVIQRRDRSRDSVRRQAHAIEQAKRRVFERLRRD